MALLKRSSVRDHHRKFKKYANCSCATDSWCLWKYCCLNERGDRELKISRCRLSMVRVFVYREENYQNLIDTNVGRNDPVYSYLWLIIGSRIWKNKSILTKHCIIQMIWVECMIQNPEGDEVKFWKNKQSLLGFFFFCFCYFWRQVFLCIPWKLWTWDTTFCQFLVHEYNLSNYLIFYHQFNPSLYWGSSRIGKRR